MRMLVTVALFAGLASLGTPASAALYTWNTTGNLSPGNGTGCAGGAACKATFTSTSGGLSLAARAYSTPIYDSTQPFNISGNWVEAKIGLYSGGIGVSNLVSGDATAESSSPNHAMDNRNVKDIMVFELPTGVWDPESFKLGWASTDSDIQAWVGGNDIGAGFDFRNVCFSGCSGTAQTLTALGFSDIGSAIPVASGGTQSPGGASAAGGVNVPTNVAVPFATTQTGRYLVMAGNLGQGSITGDNDYFKISQVVANKLPGVPAPGSILLLGLGLFALGVARARA